MDDPHLLRGRLAELEAELARLDRPLPLPLPLPSAIAPEPADRIAELEAAVAARDREITALHATRVLRWTRRPRRVYGWIIGFRGPDRTATDRSRRRARPR